MKTALLILIVVFLLVGCEYEMVTRRTSGTMAARVITAMESDGWTLYKEIVVKAAKPATSSSPYSLTGRAEPAVYDLIFRRRKPLFKEL